MSNKADDGKWKYEDVLKRANKTAQKRASKMLSYESIMLLLTTAFGVYKGNIKIKEAAETLSKEFGKPAMIYAEVFAQFAIKGLLKESKSDVLKNLGKKDFSRKLVKLTEDVSKELWNLKRGNIEPEDLIKHLGKDVKTLSEDIVSAYGGKEKFVASMKKNAAGLKAKGADFVSKSIGESKNIDAAGTGPVGNAAVDKAAIIAVAILSFAAAVEAYRILRKSIEDANIQHESRLVVEEESRKTIALIAEYRAEMEAVVSQYLGEHLDVFEDGFKAMDQALLENDVDGYIRGNNEIARMLGHEIQFTNQEEFDDLMESDIAFKL